MHRKHVFYEFNPLALRMRLVEGRIARWCALLCVKFWKKKYCRSIQKVNANHKFHKIIVHFSQLLCAWILLVENVHFIFLYFVLGKLEKSTVHFCTKPVFLKNKKNKHTICVVWVLVCWGLSVLLLQYIKTGFHLTLMKYETRNLASAGMMNLVSCLFSFLMHE